MKLDIEKGVQNVYGRPVDPFTWNLMLVVGVVFYASYTVLVHLCEENGHIPFSSASMNLLIELTKLSICIIFLLRSRLGIRAVHHLFWMAVHPNLFLPYTVPAFLYFVNSNMCIHMQLQMDPITFQICICAVVLAPAIYRGKMIASGLTVRSIAPFSVPALLYFINNNLAVHMQIQMDPATYQVLGNFKILTTAVLYRIIIKRPISRIQWVALFLLLLAGISNSYGGFHTEGKPLNGNLYITLRGILMVLCYCVISGLAGVYSEYIFKNKYEIYAEVESNRDISKIECGSRCQGFCLYAISDNDRCYLIFFDNSGADLNALITSLATEENFRIYRKQEIELKNCKEWLELGFTVNGVYWIDPDGQGSFPVYCELDPIRTDGSNDSGWTVFQKRVDSSVDFLRNWDEYVAGFGKVSSSYWLGLGNIYRLIATGPVELHVFLETFTNTYAYAHYATFQISDSSDNYRLSVSGYSGNAGDALSGDGNNADGMQFTTIDRDNDLREDGNCAVDYTGGWWYRSCHLANLNGQYLGGSHTGDAWGVNWIPYTGHLYSLKTAVMKIRPL